MDRIIVNNVNKKFTRPPGEHTALETLARILSGKKLDDGVCVLNDISFRVASGEVLGIMGKNGSGKSTLLKAIAGIFQIDSGSIYCNGKPVCITGIGGGLKSKLTLLENIYLIGALLGLRLKDIRSRIESILEFAGLENRINHKVFTLSSGMVSRLSISVMLHSVEHMRPEVLLLDEIFGGGGDMEFSKKSVRRMGELIKAGSSVILVSHDPTAIKSCCDRALLLDNGRVVYEGSPAEITERYISICS